MLWYQLESLGIDENSGVILNFSTVTDTTPDRLTAWKIRDNPGRPFPRWRISSVRLRPKLSHDGFEQGFMHPDTGQETFPR